MPRISQRTAERYVKDQIKSPARTSMPGWRPRSRSGGSRRSGPRVTRRRRAPPASSSTPVRRRPPAGDRRRRPQGGLLPGRRPPRRLPGGGPLHRHRLPGIRPVTPRATASCGPPLHLLGRAGGLPGQRSTSCMECIVTRPGPQLACVSTAPRGRGIHQIGDPVFRCGTYRPDFRTWFHPLARSPRCTRRTSQTPTWTSGRSRPW
jgi:hypothetical protein